MLAASMLMAPTFITSTEGAIYVFFIITPPLCLWHLPLYGEKLTAALVGVWLLLFYFFYHSPPEALPIEGKLSEGLRGSFI